MQNDFGRTRQIDALGRPNTVIKYKLEKWRVIDDIVLWQDMAASFHREAVVAASCQYNRTAVGRQNEAAKFARRARAHLFDLLGSEPE